jgi:hypothetical protein
LIGKGEKGEGRERRGERGEERGGTSVDDTGRCRLLDGFSKSKKVNCILFVGSERLSTSPFLILNSSCSE